MNKTNLDNYTINQVGDAIKQSSTDNEIKSSTIIDRHWAYASLFLPINKDTNTISDLIEKSGEWRATNDKLYWHGRSVTKSNDLQNGHFIFLILGHTSC